MVQRRELLTWNDVSLLINNLLRQFDQNITAMVLITRGGLIPGGILAEAMKIESIYTASIDFPAELTNAEKQTSPYLVWPKFLQFPQADNMKGQTVLIVDDVWGSGRTITAVKNRISSEGGRPYTCVLHYNPNRSLFGKVRPDYYAATTDAYVIYPWEVDHGFEPRILNKII